MNCEDGHECRLLNKKTTQIARQGKELRIYEYTYTKNKYTRPFRDATALMGSRSVVKNYRFGCKLVTEPPDMDLLHW
jgi:hypothetical protein